MWDQGISIEAKYCILPTEKQNPKYVTVKNLSGGNPCSRQRIRFDRFAENLPHDCVCVNPFPASAPKVWVGWCVPLYLRNGVFQVHGLFHHQKHPLELEFQVNKSEQPRRPKICNAAHQLYSVPATWLDFSVNSKIVQHTLCLCAFTCRLSSILLTVIDLLFHSLSGTLR